MKLFLYILVGLPLYVWGQQDTSKQSNLFSIVGDEDSITGYLLRDAVVYAINEDSREYIKTKYFVRRVYDYAMIAAGILNDCQDTIKHFDKKKDQKKFLKEANKQLKEEFGDEIKNMSVTRGEYLMKLIYRETEMTVYDVIKDYKGKGTAIWLQTLCLINGQNLKVKYDPDGEDRLIERVVQDIEAGRVSVIKRPPKTEKGKEIEIKKKKKRKKK